MPDVDRQEYVQLRDAIAGQRARIIGLPFQHMSANSADRIQEIRGLGFTESDAKWLASLPSKTLDAILPTADGIAIARDNGVTDLAGHVRILAAQCNPPIGVPADFGTGTDTATAPQDGHLSNVVRVG